MKTQSSNIESAKSHFEVGNSLQEKGQLTEAVHEYKRVIELHPKHTQALRQMGDIYNEQGKQEDAIEYYRKAIETQPKSPGIHIKLARTLAEVNRLDEAVTAYRMAISLKPDVNFNVYSNSHTHEVQ
jgi:tetratricopeptide (TPR) repeat protein